MKKFMDENFLLKTETAQKLFHDYAKDMPIYDYHCHLNPKEIAEDKKYTNITEIWLYGDHYKWRFMRSMGVEERFCTGDATDYEKFLAYATVIAKAVGNPLYHWTHLELQRYFGIYEPLNEKTAPEIWEKANKIITEGGFSAQSLIKNSNVALIGTTDDPIDSLEYHKQIKEMKDFSTTVVPTFRPDKAVNIDLATFVPYMADLSKASGVDIKSFADLKKALTKRVEFFHEMGSRISDHAVTYVPYIEADEKEIEKIFKKALSGKALTEVEIEKYKTAIITYLAKEYARLDWTLQLHIGALRNNNAQMFEKLGPDTGFDSIDDNKIAYKLSRFLDNLNKDDNLPKTILYSLNPNDNFTLGTMLGNFQKGGVKGKIQFGSAWWFNDHIDGMVEQMKALGNLGALAAFVGMLTDSRSFLSYPRHEYFRRILCNIIGQWVEDGEVYYDEDILKEIVQGVCYNNAKDYFKMN